VKRVIVRPAAAADIEEAYDWYEQQRPGLGEEFLTAIRSTLDRMVTEPEAFAVIHRATRRALVPHRYQLLDQTNYRKSVDQLVSLLQVLDCDVDLVVRAKSA